MLLTSRKPHRKYTLYSVRYTLTDGWRLDLKVCSVEKPSGVFAVTPSKSSLLGRSVAVKRGGDSLFSVPTHCDLAGSSRSSTLQCSPLRFGWEGFATVKGSPEPFLPLMIHEVLIQQSPQNGQSVHCPKRSVTGSSQSHFP